MNRVRTFAMRFRFTFQFTFHSDFYVNSGVPNPPQGLTNGKTVFKPPGISKGATMTYVGSGMLFFSTKMIQWEPVGCLIRRHFVLFENDKWKNKGGTERQDSCPSPIGAAYRRAGG
jgi:hypothetical protein